MVDANLITLGMLQFFHSTAQTLNMPNKIAIQKVTEQQIYKTGLQKDTR
jgi:hypothetical protein